MVRQVIATRTFSDAPVCPAQYREERDEGTAAV